MSIFSQFADAFGKSDKKTYKDNLAPFFATAENSGEYLSIENFAKFEDKAADKWNDILKGVSEDPNHVFKALRSKD